MQLVSRYLVSNKSVVVIDDTGNLTEYRKVYQRNIKIAKGIDNVITFEIKNHEQKPVSILNTYTPYVEVFTEDNVLLKRYVGTIKETSTPNFKGHFTITLQMAIHLIRCTFVLYCISNETADMLKCTNVCR